MRRKIAIVVVLLVLVSGCTASQTWQLGANGSVEQVDEGNRFTGEVALSGKTGQVQVEGIRVIFLAADNTTLETVQVGTLGDDRNSVDIDVVFDRIPERVLVKVERIDAPSESDYGITGLERGDDGNYFPDSEYDPST